MPIIIAVPDGTIPVIIEGDNLTALQDDLGGLSIAPEDMSQAGIIAWLSAQPRPAGWYNSRAAALAAAKVAAEVRPVPSLAGEVVRDIRKDVLGLSRLEFARALGIGGSDDTASREINKIERGVANRKLGPTRLERLYGLLMVQELDITQAAE